MLGINRSQLTDSYFSEGYTYNQLNMSDSRITGWSNLPCLCLLLSITASWSSKSMVFGCHSKNQPNQLGRANELLKIGALCWFYLDSIYSALFFVKHVKPLPLPKMCTNCMFCICVVGHFGHRSWIRF